MVEEMKTGYLKSTKLAAGLGLLLALTLVLSMSLPVVADEPPPITMKLYGDVSVCGTAAPAGTEVQAKIDGEVVETGLVDGTGQYGIPTGIAFKVPGEEGDTVELWVMGQNIVSVGWVLG